ncbi:MAG: von Willebrand factor type A domain-containing protein [Planctomycetota bacterium]
MNDSHHIPDDAQRDELHELLCAYLLGEASEAEIERVQAALSTDPELRAERDRLEAAMALVRQHGGAVSSASEEEARVERIAAAARGASSASTAGPSTSPPGNVFPFARMAKFAAGFVGLAAAGLIAMEVFRPGGESAESGPFTYSIFGEGRADARPDQVASARSAGRAGSDAQGDGDRQNFLGATTGPAKSADADDTFSSLDASLHRDAIRSRLESLGYTDATMGSAILAPKGSGQDGVAFDFEAGTTPDLAATNLSGGNMPLLELDGLGVGSSVQSTPPVEQPAANGVQLARGGSTPSAQPELAKGGGAMTGSRDFSFGADAPPVREYRGPGDSRPPTPSQQAAATSAPTGPVTGGPGGPTMGGPAVPAGGPTGGASRGAVSGGGKIGLGADPSELRSAWHTHLHENGDDDSRRHEFQYSTEHDLVQEILAMLSLAPADLPDLLEGLGYLPSGYTGDLTDAEGRSALGRLVESKRDELESARMARQLEALLQSCRRLPGESLRDMFFRHWGQRPFIDASVDALSTFAADVDTASYTLARRMLLEGVMPTKAQIRTEEFVNYFDAGLDHPREETFRIQTDLGPAAFADPESGTWMLRVGIAGKVVDEAERDPMALTFVVDTSGSMKTGGRLELVKDALRQLLTKLDSRDQIAIVRFSNEASVVLPPTSAAQRGVIEAAFSTLEPKGGTSVQAGLNKGYDLAAEHLVQGANNRVVFLSDGVGNIGETDQRKLVDQVADRRAKGIYLNTIGFGITNHNDVFLEQLANQGDGLCNYVDSSLEARRALVENFTGAFQTIARDVKIQVEFDPARVGHYRLLGYENRAIADREFRQDDVDAGEIGAGHSVVALYELVDVDLSEGAGPLATVRVRYKQPFAASPTRDEDTLEPPADEIASEIEHAVTADGVVWSFEALPAASRAAQCAAQLAEVLRRSAFTRGDAIADLEQATLAVADRLPDETFREFAAIVSANVAALEALIEPATEVQAALDELKYLRYEVEREREASGDPDGTLVTGLETRIKTLEEQIERQLFANRR